MVHSSPGRVADLMKTIEAAPRSSALWCDLAAALAELGELEQARFAAQNALVLDPDRAEASRLLQKLERRLAGAVNTGIPAELAPWDAVVTYGPGTGTQRPVFTEHLAWAVPSRRAIDAIVSLADGSTVLEVGAGRGLWSRLIADAGGRVVATDANPPERTWTEVRRLTAREARERVPARVLLLCWPPPSAPVASCAIDGFEGTVVYVGEEGEQRITADDAFFDDLHARFVCTDRLQIPVWPGFSDELSVWIPQEGGGSE